MSEKMIESTSSFLTDSSSHHQVLLTTFRRNGEGVATPVGTVTANNKIYFMTPAHTWKAKRIARDPRVTLAPSTGRGKPLGPAIEGTAVRLYGDEAQQAKARLRTGLLGKFWNLIFALRFPGDKTAFYEVTLTGE